MVTLINCDRTRSSFNIQLDLIMTELCIAQVHFILETLGGIKVTVTFGKLTDAVTGGIVCFCTEDGNTFYGTIIIIN